MSPKLRLFSWLLLVNVLWAPVNALVSVARSSGFSPLGIALVRWSGICICLFALMQLAAVQKALHLKKPTLPDSIKAIAIGALLTAPAHLSFYVALQHTLTVEGTVFNTTSPFWTALFAGFILGERISARRWLALVIAMVGTYITSVGFGLPQFEAGHTGWNLLYIGGILLESVGGVLALQIIRRGAGAKVFALETVGMSGVFLLLPLLSLPALPLVVPSFSYAWLALAYLVICSGVFTFGAWYVIAEKAPISLMVISIALQPPFAAVVGHFFLGELVTLQVLIGATVVTAALVIAFTEKNADSGVSAALLSTEMTA